MSGNTSKIVKLALLPPVILVLLGIVFCEINKAYWDHQVRLMCEKDGGVTIYEQAAISKYEYQKITPVSTGQIVLPFEKDSNSDDMFFRQENTEYLKRIFPDLKIVRYEYDLIRNYDKKIIAKSISYGRGGGDFPTGLIHPSSFNCIDIPGFNANFSEVIFSIQGE